MHFDWFDWSNPVALWWTFLVTVSALNIGLLLGLRAVYRANPFGAANAIFAAEPLALLSAVYVFGCAFRSLLPRADVERICLFNTWLSSVLVGRSVATVAELCFAIQWAIILRELGRIAHSDTAKNIATLIVPLIAVAEVWSWYAVISTNFLGNVLENSLWTIAFALVVVALVRLAGSFHGIARWIVIIAAAGAAAYVLFMMTIDVPMYLQRWQQATAHGQPLLGLVAGLHDLASRWTVTHDIVRWRDEIAWMSLYFSIAVWASLLLGGFGLIRHLIPRYRVRRPLFKQMRRRPAPVAMHYARSD
jgi:hypothetical protein